ncbi:MAG: hypothetical protein L6290_01580, partial [Thermodesulfovibrionales bacterium]|nr:hypothetical protein [Thermodesulfovibrionales bacterium]
MNQNLTLNKQILRDKKHDGAPFISYALSLFLVCSFIAVVAGCAGTKSKDKEAMQIQEPTVITGISV